MEAQRKIRNEHVSERISKLKVSTSDKEDLSEKATYRHVKEGTKGTYQKKNVTC